MRTYYVYKKIAKEGKKRFIREKDNRVYCWDEYKRELLPENKIGRGYKIIELDELWEEVKEPVDFMTAFSAWEKGKTIRHENEYEGEIIMTTEFDGKNEFAKFGAGLIGGGKWYIED